MELFNDEELYIDSSHQDIIQEDILQTQNDILISEKANKIKSKKPTEFKEKEARNHTDFIRECWGELYEKYRHKINRKGRVLLKEFDVKDKNIIGFKEIIIIDETESKPISKKFIFPTKLNTYTPTRNGF